MSFRCQVFLTIESAHVVLNTFIWNLFLDLPMISLPGVVAYWQVSHMDDCEAYFERQKNSFHFNVGISPQSLIYN